MSLSALPISSQELALSPDINQSINDVIAILNQDVNMGTGPEVLFEEETMPSTALLPVPADRSGAFPPREGAPDQVPFPGCYQFTAKVSKTESKKYLFSEELNKMYVDMECDFAVQFGWNNPWDAPSTPMYVRATTVFTEREHKEKRVECCMQHRHPPDGSAPDHVSLNVLHSARARGTPGVFYGGVPARPDSWYSVLVQLGAAPRDHAYRFVCKNSCSTGIKRRAIGIVFTLEDANGMIYGRQLVNTRVCSCPPRDRRKDLEAVNLARRGKKRLVKRDEPVAQDSNPQGQTPLVHAQKRVKVEAASPSAVDETIFTLPQLQVVGANTMITGLEMMIRMMEYGMNLRRDDHQYVANCTACIRSLKDTIENYRLVNGLPDQ